MVFQVLQVKVVELHERTYHVYEVALLESKLCLRSVDMKEYRILE